MTSRAPGRAGGGDRTPLRWSFGAAAALLLAGCAHALHGAHDPGVVAPVARCTPDTPPPTPAVARGEAGGLVFVDYTVDANGAVGDIKPGADEPNPDPALFAATRDWLQRCAHAPGKLDGAAIPVRVSKAFGFNQPYAEANDPAPLDWSDAAAKTLSAPRIVACLPQDPPLLDRLDDARMSVVIRRDGRAGPTRLAEHLGEEDGGDYPYLALWLRTCKFEPARNQQGEAIAVRVGLPLLFGDGQAPAAPRDAPPLADGLKLPIPQPSNNCDLHPWPRAAAGSATPAEAIAPLEVDYTVDPDGNASEIALRSPARREVFHAVRRWLLGCRFLATHDETGEALRVRVRRTFKLRLGTRQPDPKGPAQRIIEGDPP